MDPCFSKPTITDDLLNFSNVGLTTTSSSTDSHLRQPLLPPPQNPFHHPSSADISFYNFHPLPSADLSVVDDLCIPNDDVAELEWFSQFMDNCFHDDVSTMVGSSVQQSDWSFNCKADHSKRSTSRAAGGKSRVKTEPNDGSSWSSSPSSAAGEGSGRRRCTHCATEKTPQWRSGPLGPKTLCNACGVRYKSGRLVPEYRPASSPTFVLSQHSNSHRKVLELRRQKELELMKLKAPPLE